MSHTIRYAAILLSTAACGGVCAQDTRCEWSVLGTDGGAGVSGEVQSLAVFDDGAGPALFAGGYFQTASSRDVNNIVRWDGSSWATLPGPTGWGVDGRVRSMIVFDDGGGPDLYVGGYFSKAGVGPGEPNGLIVNGIARWDGSHWSALEGPDHPGIELCEGFFCYDHVAAMAVFDDGSGPALYVGGNFTSAGGEPVRNIARWDGDRWTTLTTPGGDPGSNGVDQPVTTMAVHDDGTGAALYVGGEFTSAGGVATNHIARWTADGWSTVDRFGVGLDTPPMTLATFDDGTGPQLFAGGELREAEFEPVFSIARWDGRAWWSLEDPLGREMYGRVHDLIIFDDGSGSALYAGGYIERTGDRTINNLGRWSGYGLGWHGLAGSGGIGLSGAVLDTAIFDDGSGPGLYAAGTFGTAGGMTANGLARWSCTPVCRADFDGDGQLTLFDFLAFQNAFAVGDSSADFDGDGRLTLFDFLTFQNAYSAGCPQ